MISRLADAIAWYQAGYMPLPVKPDGSKAPAVRSWTTYQKERPSLTEVIELFKVDHDGLGILTGAVSGNFELLELEGRAVEEMYWSRLGQAFFDHDQHELWERIQEGYIERTPSGGIHFYYRVDGRARRNTKLARRPGANGPEVLIETRGEGGFTVIAPSAGRSHPTGEPWVIFKGAPSDIPLITEEELDTIHAIASTLDEMPVQEPPPPSRGNLSLASEGLRPGDDFNARATWKEILEPHGWTCSKHYGRNLYGWRKPGKTHPGISATTGRNEADRLYVFSTSTEFEPERPYSKFGAYSLLVYGGDFAAAARDLRARGYGGDRPDPKVGAADKPQLTVVDGTSAVAPAPAAEAQTGFAFTHGGTFILDTDPNPIAVWGRGDSVLMASGEALIIAAPQGCGKTTLAGQIMLGRCGFEEYTELLNYPILPGQGRVLYLAMDRPKQAARSFRRMVGTAWRGDLDEKLAVWQGPPPGDIAKYPHLLLELCKRAEADTVIVDSLKDAAVGLSDDDIGAGYNRARQIAIADGVEVIELHHLRKLPSTKNNRSPAIDDLYGSTWLTSGAGSVILLTGEPGDSVVGFHHVKQPVAEVGPLRVSHDHLNGRSTIWHQVDLVPLARTRLSGISALEAAQAMFETDKPTTNEKEKARRKLDHLVKIGLLEVVKEGQPGADPTRYGGRVRGAD